MAKKYFTDLAYYNIWANNKVISWCGQLSDEQWEQELISSFNSLAATVLHLASAEDIWTKRMMGETSAAFLAQTFQGDKTDLLSRWTEISKNLSDCIASCDEARYNDFFYFKRLNGEESKSTYKEAFAHVLNHSTYHRGQLVTLLRQVGFTGVSSTDLLNYYREINN